MFLNDVVHELLECLIFTNRDLITIEWLSCDLDFILLVQNNQNLIVVIRC